jgi:hypothetical protein
MRIALTITELDPGGAERTMVQLARYLKRRSHCVEVFALGETSGKTLGVSPERTCLHEKLLQAEIPWHCGHAQGAVSLPRAVVWLKRKLAEFRPDLIQSMLFHANVVTALANRWLDLPHVGGARVAQPQWWRRRMQQWATNNHMEKLVCVSHSLAQDCTTRERSFPMAYPFPQANPIRFIRSLSSFCNTCLVLIPRFLFLLAGFRNRKESIFY